MKNEIAAFNFKGKDVTTIIGEDGEPWFVAKEVCDILMHSNVSAAVKDHCKHVKILKPNESLGLSIGPRGCNIIPESDLYRLIIRSKLPAAEEFEKWVVEDVLPSIRRTGQYSQQDTMTALNDPATMRTLLLSYTEKVIALEKKIETDKPKVAGFDKIAGAEGHTCITDTAKVIQVQPKLLFNWMSFNKWIYRRVGGKGWVAYQDKIQQGLLSHKVTTISTSDGTERTVENVVVTPKGVAKLSTASIQQ